MSQNAQGGGFRSRSRKGRARSGAHGAARSDNRGNGGDNRGNGGENRGHGRSRRDGRKISDARGARPSRRW